MPLTIILWSHALAALLFAGVAMRRLVEYANFRLAPPVDVSALPPRDLSAHLQSATLSEFDSKSLLREAGIALPDETLVTARGELDAAMAGAGFPLVMKIQSRDIPHKSEAGGVRVNLIPKDGGNSYAGSEFFAFANHGMQGTNLTPQLAALGVTSGDAVKRLWDSSITLGGPIQKDKLWFFGAFRDVGNRNIVANTFMPDGSPGIFDQHAHAFWNHAGHRTGGG